MARLYANENFPLPVVEELRRLGHDVLTSLDAGNAGRAVPDEEVLAFATAHDRVVLTLNRKHFVKLHQRSTEHAGIIICTFDADLIGQVRRIDVYLGMSLFLQGEIMRVNRPNPR